MRFIKALAALAVLATVTAGLPFWLAVTFANPYPAEGISWNAPLTDNGLTFVLVMALWALWALFTWCVITETVDAVRHRHRHTDTAMSGGLGPLRGVVRPLVNAVLVVGFTVPTLVAGGTDAAAGDTIPAAASTVEPSDAAAAHRGPATTTAAQDTGTAQQTTAEDDDSAATTTVTVHRGDTLWHLAETHLGEGDRYEEIVALNEGRTMNDGNTFRSALAIQPGWEISLPGDATGTEPQDRSDERLHVVEEGDTLSQVALDELGDAEAYPRIFEDSQDLDQPVPLTDPDRIYPGQVLDVGGAAASDRSSEPAPTTGTDSAREPAAEPVAPRAVEQDAPGEEPQTRPTPAPDRPSSRAAEATGDAPAEASTADDAATAMPGWVLPGLASGGGLLAASLLVMLRRRRTEQGRLRRPGAVPAAPPAAAQTVEKSLAAAGETATDGTELIDQVLRRLATNLVQATGALPSIAAVELTDTVVALHLRTALRPPEPWSSTEDHLTWIIDRTVDLDAVGPEPEIVAAAPWPLMVTVGVDESTSATWLLNLEGVNLKVTGDPLRSRNFVRHVAAGVACNPWGRDATVDLVGVGAELTPINPLQLSHHDSVSGPATQAVAHAVSTVNWLDHEGPVDVAAARVGEVGPELWLAKMVVVDDRDLDTSDLNELSDLVAKVSSRSATAVVTTPEHADEDRGSLVVNVDEFGRLEVASVGLNLTAVSLTVDEATGCALLLHHAEFDTDEAAADVVGEEEWTEFATTTGSLREQYSVDRSAVTLEQASSVLPKPDDNYIEAAATTHTDLSALAPKVTESVREAVAAADPSLDDDLDAWFADDHKRPRLSLLGPVHARATGTALDRRVPFYTELFAFLALRPQGATAGEIGAAFDLSEARSRTDANVLRAWLGADPHTGEQYLPDARTSAAAQVRGVSVYEVVDVLTDFDLFRRLRLRAESSGEAGVEDLEKALQLVSGKPFDQLRAKGWGWLLEGARTDQHAVCAIADVAHLVVTARLEAGDLDAARAAVTVALNAAPDEEITRLDLAAVLDAEGHTEQALALVRDGVCNRSEDGGAPLELADRTEEIIAERDWARRVV